MLDFTRRVVSSGTNQRYQIILCSPVQTEITAENLEVYGHIPKELPGLHVRDTPLKAETGQPIMTSRLIADLVAYLESLQE